MTVTIPPGPKRIVKIAVELDIENATDVKCDLEFKLSSSAEKFKFYGMKEVMDDTREG